VRRRRSRFVSPDALAELDFVAQRYGARPCRLLGIDPDADEDSRILAYHVDRLAAHAGVWQELQFLHPATAPVSNRPAEGGTFNAKDGLKGRIPVDEAACPPWLDALFPEGEIARSA